MKTPRLTYNLNNKTKQKKGQIAIEFILLTTFGFISLIILLIVINNILSSKLEEKTFQDFEKFGESIKSEFIVASEMESGYHRVLNLPTTINGKAYTLDFGVSKSGIGYFTLTTYKTELFFQIPEVNGNLTPGYNTIIKENNTITILQGKQ